MEPDEADDSVPGLETASSTAMEIPSLPVQEGATKTAAALVGAPSLTLREEVKETAAESLDDAPSLEPKLQDSSPTASGSIAKPSSLPAKTGVPKILFAVEEQTPGTPLQKIPELGMEDSFRNSSEAVKEAMLHNSSELALESSVGVLQSPQPVTEEMLTAPGMVVETAALKVPVEIMQLEPAFKTKKPSPLQLPSVASTTLPLPSFSSQTATLPMHLSTAPESTSQVPSESLASVIEEPCSTVSQMFEAVVSPGAVEPGPPSSVDSPSMAVQLASSDGVSSTTHILESKPAYPLKLLVSLEPVVSSLSGPLPTQVEESSPFDVIATASLKETLQSVTGGPLEELRPSAFADSLCAPAIEQEGHEAVCHVSPTSHVEPLLTARTMGPFVLVDQTVEPPSAGMGEALANDSLQLPSSSDCESLLEPAPSVAIAEACSSGVTGQALQPFVSIPEVICTSEAEQASEPSFTVERKEVINDLLLASAMGSSSFHQAEPLPSVAHEKMPASGSRPLLSTADAAGTFGNNLVSSVVGETVLVVDRLDVPSSTMHVVNKDLPASKSETTDEQKEANKDGYTKTMHAVGHDLVGQKVRKRFGRKYFEGEIIKFDPELQWYKVVYEDGDEEELDPREIRQILHSRSDAEEERPPRERSRWSSGTSNNEKSVLNKAKRLGALRSSPKASDQANVAEENHQIQEKLRLRGSRKRNVIDTSNEGGAELSDEIHLSESTDQASEAKSSESQDEGEVEKHTGSRRKVRGKRRRSEDSSRSGKKRKSAGKSDVEEEFVTSESRLRSKQKAESVLKGQETLTEHRIATRSSTGSLSTHISPSEGLSSPLFKKVQEDSQEKLKMESLASRVLSPLGGGTKLIGRKTRKDFGGEFYSGEIIGYDSRAKYYKVRYEDGDEEELEWDELKSTLMPQEEQQQVLALEAPYQAVRKFSKRRLKEHSRRIQTPKGKQGALVLYDAGANNGELPSPARRWRKKIRTASVSVMMKGTEDWTAAPVTPPMAASPPRPLAAARFASASDADIFEYFGWGEVVSFEKSKCPELRAARLLPTSSPVVHLAASRHHLAAITAAGQVWVWRSKHGNIRSRCNEWEHISSLDERNVILVDISGPDLDRINAGYEAEQEDQVPDPFYLVAVCSNGEDVVLQGSQPHESVHTWQYDDEPRHPGLRDALLQSNSDSSEGVGKIVQVSVGTVEAADESPFVGYITDIDRVYLRSATRDYMEEVNLVTGYTGKPVKIQCGRVYHAIIMTDDGRAWTWGQGYYPGSNSISSSFASKWSSPFSVCQPAVGTLVGRKVVDVGCYGEDFIALTNDGDVHQWTHAVPNPAAGVYNVPATPIYGQGPSIANGDKLKQVSIGAGMCAGISECGKVHSWRTSMKGGFVGVVGSERDALTPLGRDEGYKETVIFSLGTRFATKVMCVASSLIVVVRRKSKPRRGGKRKLDVSFRGKVTEEKATPG